MEYPNVAINRPRSKFLIFLYLAVIAVILYPLIFLLSFILTPYVADLTIDIQGELNALGGFVPQDADSLVAAVRRDIDNRTTPTQNVTIMWIDLLYTCQNSGCVLHKGNVGIEITPRLTLPGLDARVVYVEYVIDYAKNEVLAGVNYDSYTDLLSPMPEAVPPENITSLMETVLEENSEFSSRHPEFDLYMNWGFVYDWNWQTRVCTSDECETKLRE
jgi:hypothetical protein